MMKKIILEIIEPNSNPVISQELQYNGNPEAKIALKIGDYIYSFHGDGLLVFQNCPPNKYQEKKLPINQEELDKIAVWLKSPEGRLALKNSQENCSEIEKIIEKMGDIDPKILREPFNI